MIKIQKNAAYWTIGIGLFTVLVLLLSPPHFWKSIESIVSSKSSSYGSYGSAGRVIDSKVHDSWKSRMRSSNMFLVSDKAETSPQRAPAKQSTKPACLRWHKVKRGQTQWHLAQAYNNRKNKQEWLRGMRWLSGKRTNDASLKIGESVCVRWARRV
jgi:hypothetical protein